MPKKTIADLANAANVSVSTVDRLISGRQPVRRDTAEHILAVAEEIGFYSTGAIRTRVNQERVEVKFGFMLLQENRDFYQRLAASIKVSAARRNDASISVRIEFANDLSSRVVAERMRALGRRVDVLAVVAAQHPLISEAIEELHDEGVPVVALISELSANCPVSYVGVDSYKAGRAAGWTLAHVCKRPGKIGIVIGSHGYKSQEANEMGFRAYFRESHQEFSLLEPVSNFEDRDVAEGIVRDLIAREPDMVGLYVCGGAVSGAVTALRSLQEPFSFPVVAHELTAQSKLALVDGYLTAVLSTPLETTSDKLVEAMLQTKVGSEHAALVIERAHSDFFISENI